MDFVSQLMENGVVMLVVNRRLATETPLLIFHQTTGRLEVPVSLLVPQRALAWFEGNACCQDKHLPHKI